MDRRVKPFGQDREGRRGNVVPPSYRVSKVSFRFTSMSVAHDLRPFGEFRSTETKMGGAGHGANRPGFDMLKSR
jgi:hypothetical protein